MLPDNASVLIFFYTESTKYIVWWFLRLPTYIATINNACLPIRRYILTIANLHCIYAHNLVFCK